MTCEHYQCDGLLDIKETSLLEMIKNKYCNEEGIDCPYAIYLKQQKDIREGKMKMFSDRK